MLSFRTIRSQLIFCSFPHPPPPPPPPYNIGSQNTPYKLGLNESKFTILSIDTFCPAKVIQN